MQLKRLTFSNMFSYGDNNVIDFSDNKVSLIEGKVGAGKSSIPTILEELLYNKNSRGFKKTEIVNSYSGKSSYSGCVEFSVGNDFFVLSKEVKTTAKVTLSKNGIDISGNTATASYKLLEEIIGLDFTTFSKLVYQSVVSQMDFLSATDAKRKEFLIGLMNLDVYSEIEEEIKVDKKNLQDSINILGSEINILSSIKRPQGTYLEEVEVPSFDEEALNEKIKTLNEQTSQIAILQATLTEYNATASGLKTNILAYNKAISKDVNVKKQVLDKLAAIVRLPQPSPPKNDELQSVTRELLNINTLMSEAKKRYEHFRADASKTSCHVCGSSLNKDEAYAAAIKAKEEYLELKAKLPALEEEKTALTKLKTDDENYSKQQVDIEKLESQLKTDSSFLQEQLDINFSKLDALVKPIFDDNSQEIKAKISKIQAEIRQYKSSIREAELHNARVKPTNDALDLAKQTYLETTSTLQSKKNLLSQLTEELNDLTVLQKSIKDLVSYRIECEIKQFEAYINEFLSKISAGKFAISFELDNTKLSVKIFNDGTQTSMSTLSSGETTQVNLSTLFAIRKLTSDINVIFLDEIVSFLDVDSKDNLVDVLLEQNWHTLMVSHGYSNPRCELINIVKENNISRIKDGN